MGRLCNCQGATELRAMVQIDETGRAWNACDLICTNCGGYAEKPEQEAALRRLVDCLEHGPRYQAGRAAYAAGVRWWQNPHDSGTVAAAQWDAGHTDARLEGRHKGEESADG